MWNKIKRYYPPYVDLISFLLLILTVVYVASYFGQLPDEIPRHFNAAGEPDAWGGKGMLIALLGIYIFVFIQCWFLSYMLIIAPQDWQDALHFINIPFVKKDELNPDEVEWIRKTTARMMASINGMVSVLFAYIIYGTIQTALAKQSGLGSMAILFVIALLIPLIWYGWKIYRFASAKKVNTD